MIKMAICDYPGKAFWVVTIIPAAVNCTKTRAALSSTCLQGGSDQFVQNIWLDQRVTTRLVAFRANGQLAYMHLHLTEDERGLEYNLQLLDVLFK